MSRVKPEPSDSESDYDDDSADERGKRRAPSSRASAPKRTVVDDLASLISLPMPHNGMVSLGGDEPVQHIFNPMWEQLFNELGERPAPRSRCWGCSRGSLGIESLPYNGYTALARELPDKVVEHGLYAAAKWAAEFYRVEVQQNLIAPPEVIAQSAWSGVSILWHFFKHTHMAQFRAVGELIELEHANDVLVNEKLFVVSAFGQPGKDYTIDRDELKALAPIRGMLDRQRKLDPKKTITFHPVLGASGKTAAAPYATDRFHGRGLLHN